MDITEILRTFLHKVRAIDVTIFEFINDRLSNTACDYIMPVITNLVSSYLLIAVALLLLLSRETMWKKAGLFMLGGITLSNITVSIFKNAVMRFRPPLALPSCNVLVYAHGYAFPSGHTTLAFTMAYILTSCFKKPILFYGLATLVGFSRIYCGIHFPIDVLAGIFVGVMLGYVITESAKKAGIL